MREIGEVGDIRMECTKRWKIEEFFSLREKEYSSSAFSFAGECWRFWIYPNGSTSNESHIKGNVSVYFSRISYGMPIKIACSMSLLTLDGKKVSMAHEEKVLRGFSHIGFVNFVLRSELMQKKSELLPSDTLTIICFLKCLALTEDGGTFSERISTHVSSGANELSSNEEDEAKEILSSKYKGMEILSENLKQMFLDGRICDTVLKADGKNFNVHKFILVARSPVFASMFQHDLAEKNTNEVDIPDCTEESFEVFLYYLYTGSVETLSMSNVYNVYYAADKYQVDDLKEKCVKFMMKSISVETFCDVIDLSLRHGESDLQKTATDFFCQNNKKIIKTVQWLKYMEANTVQANELFIKVLKA